MKPVDQLTDSDCLRASIASIFEMKLEEVPYFGYSAHGTERAALQQDTDVRNWLEGIGLEASHIQNPDAVFEAGGKSARMPWGYCVGNGKSPRGDWHHSTVYLATRGMFSIAHDPHSSRDGLRGRPDDFTCFLMIDPSLFRAWCDSRKKG